MSIDETLSHGVQIEDDHDRALTSGILSFALGLTGAMGGGLLANAFQYWAYDLARLNTTGGNLLQAMSALPSIILGIVAIALGLVAARSNHALASATGKAGATIGILAVVGGCLWGASMLTSDFM